MTTIYFIRHARTDYTVKDEVYRPLTCEGGESALRVMEFLSEIDIDVIYSSPYKRTVDTIKPYADSVCMEIELVNDLREREIGCWVDDFDDFSFKQWHDFNYKLKNGESLQEVQDRNIQEVNSILKVHKNKTIAVATHGTALASIINYYDERFLYEGFQSIKHKMPLIMIAKFRDDNLIDIKEVRQSF